MTDRERWIIYPLLFLALGAALRDKLAKQTSSKLIACEQLFLVDPEGQPMAYLNGSELRFDAGQGGRGNGFVWANTIDAETLAQRGQPVAGGRQVIQIPPQLQGLLKMVPQIGTTPPDDKIAPPANELPQSPPKGPALQAPAVEPPGEA